MTKLFVIRDDVMKVDTFTFQQSTEGAAGSYFYNWCLMQQHRNFSLHVIAEIGYIDDQYTIIDIDRKHIVNMPVEVE